MKTTNVKTNMLCVCMTWLLLFALTYNLAVAQREPATFKISDKAREVIFNNCEPIPITNPKDGNWWEPDTVTTYGLSGTNRYVYSYYTNGMKKQSTSFVKISEGWLAQSEYQCIYDNNRNLLSQTFLMYSQELDLFINQSRVHFTYNAQNKKTSESYEYWDWENDQWITYTMKTFTYNERYDLQSELYQEYQNSEWKNIYFSDYQYDYYVHTLSKINKNWNNETNDWINSAKFFYTFDASGNLISEYSQYWRDNQWTNVNGNIIGLFSQFYEYTYDSENNLLTRCNKYWQDDFWVEYLFSTYTYNESNRMLTCTTSLISDDIMEMNLTINEYDIHNNCTSTLWQYWENDQWESLLLHSFTFDENGNCRMGTTQIWTGNGWNYYDCENLIFMYNNSQSTSDLLFNCHRIEATYTKVNKPVNIYESSQVDILIYPNPAQNKINILAPNFEIERVELYNLFSQKLGEYNQSEISVSHLPAGIYFVRVNMNAGAWSGQFVKR